MTDSNEASRSSRRGKTVPLLSLTITPLTLDEAQKLARALELLTAEDPRLQARTDNTTGQAVIGCVSEQHLEEVVDRLKREFSVSAAVGRPEVIYREALTRPAEGEAKHANQASGRATYAHVKVRLCPEQLGDLWVPNALILEGLEVMRRWGFTYKTNIVWFKTRKDGGPDGRGVGFYFRNVTELLLFGTRGKNNRTLAPGRTQTNIIATRKREHSRKPDEQYDIIERCSPGPYLEMFARHTRQGWNQWGNEAPDTRPQLRLFKRIE